MSLRILLAAAVTLMIAVAIRTWLPVDGPPYAEITAPDTRFDYTLTDFSATFRDEGDRLELLLSGPRLEHEIGERIGHLSEPRFHIEPDGADWSGQARRGIIRRDEEELLLEEDIELIHRHPDGDIRISARSLHHHRGQRTITSDEAVEIHQAGSWLRAGGLIIHLDDNIIELTDHVQGELQPSAIADDLPAGTAGSG